MAASFESTTPGRKLILASASPRRAELLAAAGFAFEVHAVDIDERTRPGEPADRYVRRLAAEKSAAAAAALRRADAIVLGADTAVVVDDEILGKPRDGDEAAAMMKRLSGRTHQVVTGISLRRAGFELGRVESTDVVFSTMSDEEIAWYVGTGEGSDKAGGYAIQGLASRFIPRVAGSYANVVGLPIAAVFELMKEITR
jgi:septum formation protein